MRITSTILLLFLSSVLFGQAPPSRFLKNNNFQWLSDSSSQDLTIYYQAESWAAGNIETVKNRVISHFSSVKSFTGINSYPARIHLFVVDSREQMKLLVGREINGSA